MNKRFKLVRTIDFSQKDPDKSIQTTAAIGKDGVIHILKTEEIPTPIFVPKPIDWLAFMETIKRNELRFSQSALENLREWSQPGFISPPLVKLMNKHRPPSAHKRIYKPGRKIKSVQGFENHLVSMGSIYYRHKFMHNGFAWGLSLRTILSGVCQGRIRKAVKI